MREDAGVERGEAGVRERRPGEQRRDGQRGRERAAGEQREQRRGQDEHGSRAGQQQTEDERGEHQVAWMRAQPRDGRAYRRRDVVAEAPRVRLAGAGFTAVVRSTTAGRGGARVR